MAIDGPAPIVSPNFQGIDNLMQGSEAELARKRILALRILRRQKEQQDLAALSVLGSALQQPPPPPPVVLAPYAPLAALATTPTLASLSPTLALATSQPPPPPPLLAFPGVLPAQTPRVLGAERLNLAATASSLPQSVASTPPSEELQQQPGIMPSSEMHTIQNHEKGRGYLHESWYDMYQRLVQYQKEHGNCLVPHRYKADPKLGRWVERQRRNRKKNCMSSLRFKSLQALGFEWCVRDKDAWDTMFCLLEQYKALHGDCRVPTKYPLDPKLGNWVQTQRQARDTLSDERRERLDSIGFVWGLRETWNNMFEQLCQYKEKHGHCNVTCSENVKLAAWVNVQRSRQQKLSIRRKMRLDDIGFVWNARDNEKKLVG